VDERAEAGGGGGSRSATIVEFSNDFENSMRSSGEKRQKAVVQVQNRDSRSARVRAAVPAPVDSKAPRFDDDRTSCRYE